MKEEERNATKSPLLEAYGTFGNVLASAMSKGVASEAREGPLVMWVGGLLLLLSLRFSPPSSVLTSLASLPSSTFFRIVLWLENSLGLSLRILRS